jgi:hypothetical protein
MHEIIARYPTSPPPPINTLVLNANKKLPGSGSDEFVRKYWPQLTYARLSDRKKREAMRKIHEDVWNYPDWPRVAKDVFKISVVPTASDDDEQEQDGKAARQGFGGPPESKEHLRLKKYVEAHPDEFGAPKGCTAETEKLLRSYDEIDVWFMVPGVQLAVEVKSVRSCDPDLRRGIFQCVKYQAVLEAEAKWEGTNPKIRTLLVSERPLPSEYAKQAKRLGVRVRVIEPLT